MRLYASYGQGKQKVTSSKNDNSIIMRIKENKGLWWLTRVLSILIIVFSILMFMGYRVFPEPGEINPLSTKAIIGFYIVGMGFIGLLLAWKWDLTGAIISLIAFAGLAVIFPMVLIPSPLYIWPVTAILFIVLWKRSRTTTVKNK